MAIAGQAGSLERGFLSGPRLEAGDDLTPLRANYVHMLRAKHRNQRMQIHLDLRPARVIAHGLFGQDGDGVARSTGMTRSRQ